MDSESKQKKEAAQNAEALARLTQNWSNLNQQPSICVIGAVSCFYSTDYSLKCSSFAGGKISCNYSVCNSYSYSIHGTYESIFNSKEVSGSCTDLGFVETGNGRCRFAKYSSYKEDLCSSVILKKAEELNLKFLRTTKPKVVNTNPANGSELSLGLDPIFIDFNSSMNPNYMISSNINIFYNGNPIKFTLYQYKPQKIYLLPDPPEDSWKSGNYTITVLKMVEDYYGNSMDTDYTFNLVVK